MAVTHTHRRTVVVGNTTTSKDTDVTSGQEQNISEAILANQTNLAVAFAFTVAKLQSIYMMSDVAMTVKTNSSGAPQETISLIANTPLVWVRGDAYLTVPFAGNVSILYVTNTTAGTLTIYTVIDPT